jgi:hypothetical protein
VLSLPFQAGWFREDWIGPSSFTPLTTCNPHNVNATMIECGVLFAQPAQQLKRPFLAADMN